MRDFFEKYGDRITPGDPNKCWEWTGSTTSSLGYGHFNRWTKHQYAHRSAYEWLHGEGSARGQVIRHKCDNPPCCNPAHLLAGTHKDNSADMHERGRAKPVFGENVNTAKLTDADVLEMRRMARAGMCVADIIRATIPVTHHAATLAIMGRTWKHLPGAVLAPSKGEPPNKLPDDVVRSVRAAVLSGVHPRDVARHYGCATGTVWDIKHKRIRANVV